MKRIVGAVVTLSALIAVSAVDISSQEDVSDRGRNSFRRGPGIEAVMSMRERLELTEDQVLALDEIRGEIVARRASAAAEMAEMRSRLQAGQIRQSEMMAFLEARRDEAGEVSVDARSRVERVLTEAQLESLQQLRIRTARRGGVTRRQQMRQGGRDMARRGRLRGPRDRANSGPPGRGFNRGGQWWEGAPRGRARGFRGRGGDAEFGPLGGELGRGGPGDEPNESASIGVRESL